MLIYKDLGGIINKENKVLKNNMLIRSANLNKLSISEIRKLEKHNLRTVIDLRTSVEREERPNTKIDNVTYKNMPIFKDKVLGITREKGNSLIKILKEMPSLSELYKMMVTDEYSVSQLKQIINEIVTSDENAILFHCTAGKDRTGIVANILLYILDVDEKEIIKSYLEINKRNSVKAKLCYYIIRIITLNKELALKTKNYLMVSEECFEETKKAINDKYGSINDFIKNELGISDKLKEEFKERILQNY